MDARAKKILTGGLAVSGLSAFDGHAAEDAPVPAKPNVVFILLDDLGKEWISCYGSKDVQTPHIDALAAGGMRFNNVYSMPQCTPSRMCLLTGQYPYRNGWVNHWDVPRWGAGTRYDPGSFPCSLGRTMREAGYATAMGGQNNAKVSDKGVENEWYFRDRVVRDKRYKLYVGTDRQPRKFVDLNADPEEAGDITGKEDAEARKSRERLEGLISSWPEKDADFICTPQPPQPWDQPVKVTSGEWKKGRPSANSEDMK